ncbi:MAG: lamin tail domain-containing protein, partial [Planctomycetales bacterium]|nr:lamin tail domain-containing protein [Planctomycetales bacterium]
HYTQVTGISTAEFFINYVTARAAYVLERLDLVAPTFPFEITSNAGAAFSTDQTSVVLEGRGWIDVDTVRVNGGSTPVPINWLDDERWQIQVPLVDGANAISLSAYNYRGSSVGEASIEVTSTAPLSAQQQFLRISELMYDAPGPQPAELAVVPNAIGADFEFIELVNISADTPLSLNGVRLTDGPSAELVLDAATGQLLPGERAVLVSNLAAFRARYGDEPRVLAEYSGNLRNQGELIRLVDSQGREVLSFEYGDAAPWPVTAAGAGYALELNDLSTPVEQLNDPLVWRAGSVVNGTPGGDSPLPGDLNHDDVISPSDIDVWCHADRNDLRYDLNLDSKVDELDLKYLVEDVLRTSFGDANLDGKFDSRDLVAIFQAGLYESLDGLTATWESGDWNCDGAFNSSDLVVAFVSGKYEA